MVVRAGDLSCGHATPALLRVVSTSTTNDGLPFACSPTEATASHAFRKRNALTSYLWKRRTPAAKESQLLQSGRQLPVCVCESRTDSLDLRIGVQRGDTASGRKSPIARCAHRSPAFAFAMAGKRASLPLGAVLFGTLRHIRGHPISTCCAAARTSPAVECELAHRLGQLLNVRSHSCWPLDAPVRPPTRNPVAVAHALRATMIKAPAPSCARSPTSSAAIHIGAC